MDETLFQTTLTTLVSQNQQILEQLKDLSEKDEDVAGDIEEIKLWMNGNGKEGAKTRISRLENDVTDLKKGIDKFFTEVSDKTIQALTTRVITIFGIPLGIALIVWIAQIIYSASVHLQGG